MRRREQERRKEGSGREERREERRGGGGGGREGGKTVRHGAGVCVHRFIGLIRPNSVASSVPLNSPSPCLHHISLRTFTS